MSAGSRQAEGWKCPMMGGLETKLVDAFGIYLPVRDLIYMVAEFVLDFSDSWQRKLIDSKGLDLNGGTLWALTILHMWKWQIVELTALHHIILHHGRLKPKWHFFVLGWHQCKPFYGPEHIEVDGAEFCFIADGIVGSVGKTEERRILIEYHPKQQLSDDWRDDINFPARVSFREPGRAAMYLSGVYLPGLTRPVESSKKYNSIEWLVSGYGHVYGYSTCLPTPLGVVKQKIDKNELIPLIFARLVSRMFLEDLFPEDPSSR